MTMNTDMKPRPFETIDDAIEAFAGRLLESEQEMINLDVEKEEDGNSAELARRRLQVHIELSGARYAYEVLTGKSAPA